MTVEANERCSVAGVVSRVGLNVRESGGKTEPSWKMGIITQLSGKGIVEN